MLKATLRPFLLFSFTVIYIACKKVEFSTSQSKVESNYSEDILFKSSDTIPIAVQKAKAAFKQKTVQYHFASKFVKHVGIPYWDKAMIASMRVDTKSGARTDASSSNDTLVLVPIVPEGKRFVNGFLVCKISSDSSTIKLFEAKNYKKYPLTPNGSGKADAMTLVRQLMIFEYNIFGKDMFVINDKRLFAQYPLDTTVKYNKRIIKISPEKPQTAKRQNLDPSSRWEIGYITTCYNEGLVPTNKGQLTGCPPGTDCPQYEINWVCHTRTVVYYIDDGADTWTAIGDSQPSGGTSNTIYSSYIYERVVDVLQEIGQNPAYLLPCNPPLDQWNDLRNRPIPQEVYNKIDLERNKYAQAASDNEPDNGGLSDPISYFSESVNPFTKHTYVQNLEDATSAIVSCDYFPIRITSMPNVNGVQINPTQLLEYFRLNMNNFIDNNIATFHPYGDQVVNDYGLWYSNNPLGAFIHIEISPNDGTVVLFDYQMQNHYLNNHFTVATMCSPLDGLHPVSGKRSWGIQNHGNGEYTFYVQGIDRMTNNWFAFFSDAWSLFGDPGFVKSDKLWRSLQDGMINFINANGGEALKYSTPEITLRTQYDLLIDYFEGRIEKAEWRRLMGC